MGDKGQRKRGQGGGTVLGHSKGWVFTPPTKPWGPREGFETEGPGLMKLFMGHVAVRWGKEGAVRRHRGWWLARQSEQLASWAGGKSRISS